jgi:hypothetical protein
MASVPATTDRTEVVGGSGIVVAAAVGGDVTAWTGSVAAFDTDGAVGDAVPVVDVVCGAASGREAAHAAAPVVTSTAATTDA